ncbi:MAG: FtsQ-type POTRA domain-containing protein [Chlamydiales bacterium]|nr:FtsQ-type POTRA domain-containing protein [Chlamydiales bacterium]
MRNKTTIPTFKALLILTVTTTLVSGGGYLLLNKKKRMAKAEQPVGNIRAIVQTGPQKEALSTSYLAELLNLSQDRPTPASSFNLKIAREKLLRSPVVKEAKVEKLPPDALFISYTVRQPVATLYDVENGALDTEGFLFPLKPFFAPKNLPEIYLGIAKFNKQGRFAWNQKLASPSLTLALDLLQLLSAQPYCDLFTVKRIDLSKAAEKSYGAREIVLIIEESFKEQKRIYLRLTTKGYAQELGNYLELRRELAQTKAEDKSRAALVDLRISKLGYIKDL